MGKQIAKKTTTKRYLRQNEAPLSLSSKLLQVRKHGKSSLQTFPPEEHSEDHEENLDTARTPAACSGFSGIHSIFKFKLKISILYRIA